MYDNAINQLRNKHFSGMTFEEQITLLYVLADGWDILHAKLVFKTILDRIKAVGYAYTYQRKLALKTLESMLSDVVKKYGMDSTQTKELSILYNVMKQQDMAMKSININSHK